MKAGKKTWFLVIFLLGSTLLVTSLKAQTSQLEQFLNKTGLIGLNEKAAAFTLPDLDGIKKNIRAKNIIQ